VSAPTEVVRDAGPSRARREVLAGIPLDRTWPGYAWGTVGVATSTAVLWSLSPYLRLFDLVLLNLLSVVAISTRFGIGPSLFTAALSALSFEYFLLPPVLEFTPLDFKHGISLVVFLVVAGVISGLAERTRRQNAAARTRELTIETERLRNSLLSAVSHDLRTPLASILGASTVLVQDGPRLDEAERLGLAESIAEEATRLNQLVTNILDAARLEGGRVAIKKRPEPLDEVVEAALARLHGRFGERPVKSRIPQAIPMVPMDAVLIQQVLVNLLENALKYSAAKSPLEVEAIREGATASVEVRDRGPGIQNEEASKLFERFYRGSGTRGRDGGVGLGLTICRAIVEAHGGDISIRNRDGGGAVAKFTLPLGSEPNP
jgi:K+-sensing histidine kinase KdpD